MTDVSLPQYHHEQSSNRTAIAQAFTSNSCIEAIRANGPMTDRDDQAARNEAHKQDQLSKQKQGKNEWRPELASNSEEAVAADRNHEGESPEELQKKTKDIPEQKHN